jgi:hypothetical protein
MKIVTSLGSQSQMQHKIQLVTKGNLSTPSGLDGREYLDNVEIAFAFMSTLHRA